MHILERLPLLRSRFGCQPSFLVLAEQLLLKLVIDLILLHYRMSAP